MASVLGVFIFGESHIHIHNAAENLLFSRIGLNDGAFMMIHFLRLGVAEIATGRGGFPVKNPHCSPAFGTF